MRKVQQLRERVEANRNAANLGCPLSWNEQLALLDLAVVSMQVRDDSSVPGHHRANLDEALQRFEDDTRYPRGEWHAPDDTPPATTGGYS